MNEMDPIEEELCQAGIASPVSPLVVKLDKFRIMSDTDVPPEEFLLRQFGKPCFPRRDLTAITGTEKCGKTFFTSMVMACAAAREKVLELERIPERPLKILWYDTEQSRASTKNIMTERIYQGTGLSIFCIQCPCLFISGADGLSRGRHRGLQARHGDHR